MGHAGNVLVDAGHPGAGDHPGHVDALIKERDVFRNRARKQHIVMNHRTDLRAHSALVPVGERTAVEEDFAIAWRVEPGDDLQQRGLATPRCPGDRHELAGRHSK